MMTKRKDSAKKAIRDIRRATRRQYSAEEKIRIVLEGLRGESRLAVMCLLRSLNHVATGDRFCSKTGICLLEIDIDQVGSLC